MRSPDHLKIKESCLEAIDKIMAKSNLGFAEKVVFDDQGRVNVTAFVNDDLVVRFNARDNHLPKFQREQIAFNSLKDVVPVPELLTFDDSKIIIPYDYMICKKMPGKNLEQNWASLSEEDGNLLAYQAGQMLGKIHSVNMENFGEISMLGPFLQTKKWTDYLRHILNYYLGEAMDLNLFTLDVKGKFLDFFESKVGLLDTIRAPKLIHGDFHLGNLLFAGQTITGVLDFEWSCAGDPLFDICNNLRDMDSRWPGSQEAFNKGYGIQDFSEEEIAKMKVYTMIKSIEFCVVAKKFFPESECKEFVQTTQNNYASLQ
ncbi:MAG: phosphotransferase [Pseudobdellovibrionaceae bacterium]